METTVLGTLLTLGGAVIGYLFTRVNKLEKENNQLRDLVFSVAIGLKSLDEPNPRVSASQIADQIMTKLDEIARTYD